MKESINLKKQLAEADPTEKEKLREKLNLVEKEKANAQAEKAEATRAIAAAIAAKTKANANKANANTLASQRIATKNRMIANRMKNQTNALLNSLNKMKMNTASLNAVKAEKTRIFNGNNGINMEKAKKFINKLKEKQKTALNNLRGKIKQAGNNSAEKQRLQSQLEQVMKNANAAKTKANANLKLTKEWAKENIAAKNAQALKNQANLLLTSLNNMMNTAFLRAKQSAIFNRNNGINMERAKVFINKLKEKQKTALNNLRGKIEQAGNNSAEKRRLQNELEQVTNHAKETIEFMERNSKAKNKKLENRNRQITNMKTKNNQMQAQLQENHEFLQKEKEQLAEARAKLRAAEENKTTSNAKIKQLEEELKNAQKSVKNAENAVVATTPKSKNNAVSTTNVNIQINSKSNSKRNNGKGESAMLPGGRKNSSPAASTGTKNVAKPVKMRNTSELKNVIRVPPLSGNRPGKNKTRKNSIVTRNNAAAKKAANGAFITPKKTARNPSATKNAGGKNSANANPYAVLATRNAAPNGSYELAYPKRNPLNKPKYRKMFPEQKARFRKPNNRNNGNGNRNAAKNAAATVPFAAKVSNNIALLVGKRRRATEKPTTTGETLWQKVQRQAAKKQARAAGKQGRANKNVDANTNAAKAANAAAKAAAEKAAEKAKTNAAEKAKTNAAEKAAAAAKAKQVEANKVAAAKKAKQAEAFNKAKQKLKKNVGLAMSDGQGKITGIGTWATKINQATNLNPIRTLLREKKELVKKIKQIPKNNFPFRLWGAKQGHIGELWKWEETVKGRWNKVQKNLAEKKERRSQSPAGRSKSPAKKAEAKPSELKKIDTTLVTNNKDRKGSRAATAAAAKQAAAAKPAAVAKPAAAAKSGELKKIESTLRSNTINRGGSRSATAAAAARGRSPTKKPAQGSGEPSYARSTSSFRSKSRSSSTSQPPPGKKAAQNGRGGVRRKDPSRSASANKKAAAAKKQKEKLAKQKKQKKAPAQGARRSTRKTNPINRFSPSKK